MDHLGFVQTVGGFRQCVVMGIADTAHGRFNIAISQSFAVADRYAKTSFAGLIATVVAAADFGVALMADSFRDPVCGDHAPAWLIEGWWRRGGSPLDHSSRTCSAPTHRSAQGLLTMKPAGHRVLVTGGATGIGFAIAAKFHAAGNQVILVGRSEATLARAAAALPGAETCVTDISVAEHRERLVQRFADITVLINNAGIQINRPIAECSPAEIERELSINFLAPVMLIRDFLPTLVGQPSSAIVNVSSGLALVPKEAAAIYCASKAALHSFSKTLRWQLAGTGVSVFEILPPLVDTAMTAGRGKGKISPARLADEFWDGFMSDRCEMLIGKTKLLAFINRLAPSVAERIMRRGL